MGALTELRLQWPQKAQAQIPVLGTLAGRRWHLIWDGTSNGRCLFQQDQEVEVWEGEPGNNGLEWQPRASPVGPYKPHESFKLCAVGRKGMGPGKHQTG